MRLAGWGVRAASSEGLLFSENIRGGGLSTARRGGGGPEGGAWEVVPRGCHFDMVAEITTQMRERMSSEAEIF